MLDKALSRTKIFEIVQEKIDNIHNILFIIR